MKLSDSEIAKIRAEQKQEQKEWQAWQRFIQVMRAKGALISHSHGQTKIKI